MFGRERPPVKVESEIRFTFSAFLLKVYEMKPKRAVPGRVARVREFKQERSVQTYERLLDAAEIVFGRKGFDAAQTPDIARQAGVSTGALYRYFDDKRQLFIEMVQRNLDRAYADVSRKLEPALFAGADTRQAIDRAIDVTFEHIQRDAPLERVYMAMSLSDPEVAKLRLDFEARALELLTALIRAVVPAEVAPDPRVAALVVQLAALEVAAERAGLRPRLGDNLPDADVKRALRDMLHRYLFPGRR
jgi:AcrR family transcriptional regulator